MSPNANMFTHKCARRHVRAQVDRNTHTHTHTHTHHNKNSNNSGRGLWMALTNNNKKTTKISGNCA